MLRVGDVVGAWVGGGEGSYIDMREIEGCYLGLDSFVIW